MGALTLHRPHLELSSRGAAGKSHLSPPNGICCRRSPFPGVFLGPVLPHFTPISPLIAPSLGHPPAPPPFIILQTGKLRHEASPKRPRARRRDAPTPVNPAKEKGCFSSRPAGSAAAAALPLRPRGGSGEGGAAPRSTCVTPPGADPAHPPPSIPRAAAGGALRDGDFSSESARGRD